MTPSVVRYLLVAAWTALHLFWIDLWTQVPPAWVMYAFYLPVVVGAVILLSPRHSASGAVLLLIVLAAVGFVSAILVVAMAELAVGRANRFAGTTVNVGYLVHMPLMFMSWLHLPVAWMLLRFRTASRERIGQGLSS